MSAKASPRIALVDFSTDDNSYTSAQSAANFTGILQAKLAQEPGIEWVERDQLDKAQHELELAAAKFVNSSESPIRTGKWVKADWMITGQFSLDDQNRRTLHLEVVDLGHADVLSEATIAFQELPGQSFQVVDGQIEKTVAVIRHSINDAQEKQQEINGKILIAPLFFSNLSEWGRLGSKDVLASGFDEALEHAAATNANVRLIRFPRAYSSLTEAEMTFEGLVGVDRQALQRMADLYVWGTYTTSRKISKDKPPGGEIDIELHLWNGVSSPLVLKDQVSCSLLGDVSADQASVVLNRMANEAVSHAQKRSGVSNAETIRREIAESILTSCNADPSLRYRDQAGFLQLMHMLGTARLFDPENQKAHFLYTICRWDGSANFKFEVKNEFRWNLRRSEAWGKYVNERGFKAVPSRVPFAYQQEDEIPMAYLRSINDLLENFPQWRSVEEMQSDDKERKEGSHTGLMSAEFHGFPREMPADLAFKWKTEVQGEHWNRLVKTADWITVGGASNLKDPSRIFFTLFRETLNESRAAAERLALLEKIWPELAKCSQKNGRERILGARTLETEQEQQFMLLCKEAGRPEKGKEFLAMLSTNQILTGTQPPAANENSTITTQVISQPETPNSVSPAAGEDTHTMFRLFPPDILPVSVKPGVREIEFPKQFEVQGIVQLEFWKDDAFVLAMDERSSPSNDKNANESADVSTKRGRLWVLKGTGGSPTLYEAASLPRTSINALFLQNDQLWLAGETTGVLNLSSHEFRKFGLADGLSSPVSAAVCSAGGHFFAAGDNFSIAEFDETHGHWINIRLTNVSLSSGTGIPTLLSGNKQQLAYAAGAIHFLYPAENSWTNPPYKGIVKSIAADDSGFWFGSFEGLHYYDSGAKALLHWPASSSYNGAFLPGMSQIVSLISSPSELETKSEQILAQLKKLERDRKQNHVAKKGEKITLDPLHLDWRIPGEITALANDGEFLWLAADSYFGSRLLLLHKATRSLVASYVMPTHDRISCVAVHGDSVWVGTAFGDKKLLELSKSSFLSVPKDRWVNLSISPEDRKQILSSSSLRDQAMYAFYAADDAQVSRLLDGINPEKASLEEMFLLAFCYDPTGLDKPELSNKWFQQIISRSPNSPWAGFAQSAIAENDRVLKEQKHQADLLAKYDLNHDGVLDAAERARMEASPDYQREKGQTDNQELDEQLRQVMKRFDLNNDGKLDVNELNNLRSQVLMYSGAPPEILSGRKLVVAPLMTSHFPAVSEILKKYDLNGHGGLDSNELKSLARDIEKERPTHATHNN